MNGKVVLSLVCMVIISGCATLGVRLAERNVEKAVELINSQDAEALARHTGKAFVFGGEILLRSSDVHAVWRYLSENDFSLKDPLVVETFTADDRTYAIFSDAEEMKVFFSKYVPAGSTVGRVETKKRTFHLLLGSGTGGYPAILGITGF